MGDIIIPQNSLTDSHSETVECYQIIEEGPYVETDTAEVECIQIIEEGPCVTETETEAISQVIEEGPRVNETETEEITQVLEEGPRLCPLCSSEIKYFFVNFTEKLLMCENAECEFPFGYEDLQFKKFEYADDMSEMTSVQHSGSQYSDSVHSSAAQMNIDKINNVACEDKLNHQFIVPKSLKQRSPKYKIYKSKKTEIKKNLEFLEKGTMELHEMEKRKSLIWNEKWIHKLKSLQEKSGVTLLEPEELRSISVKEDNEVKLDIERGDGNSMCSIKILISPPSTSNA